MPILTPALLQALCGEMTPKFLATRDANGMPNVVPCISLQPADDQPDTLFFGNFLLRKSLKNLEADKRLAILVITPELRGWMLRGDFIEFQRTGPYVDRQMNSSLLRYNAYTGIRNAGIIRVTALEGSFAISKLQVALDFARARLAALTAHPREAEAKELPLAVRREFGKMAAVKVMAWVRDNGYPIIVPALSLQPAGHSALISSSLASDLPAPSARAQVAVNILTFEAVSYQAKGIWNGRSLAVQEVYAGGPPIPGGRIV